MERKTFRVKSVELFSNRRSTKFSNFVIAMGHGGGGPVVVSTVAHDSN